MTNAPLDTPNSHQDSASGGTTPSERYLAKLGRKTFLSLWSYSNLYTNEGRRGEGDGKELCDLLVVFGDHILIFSDKHCEFPTHPDLSVAWQRWYKRAVEKSARQLVGARNWIARFPQQIFLDRNCTKLLPIPIPQLDKAIFHLIAVTRGSYSACRSHFGGTSIGSLMINSAISGTDHYHSPFTVGRTLPNGPFVHVIDEHSLDVLLGELDTIKDLVEYLDKKEKFLTNTSCFITTAGEEQLVAMYVTRVDSSGRHNFNEIPPDTSGVWIQEGYWEGLVTNPQYKAKKKADSISYTWDRLIEHLIKYGEVPEERNGFSSMESFEPALRLMASETRLARRQLAELLIDALKKQVPTGSRFLRIGQSSDSADVGYAFLVLPKPDYINTYAEYREARCAILLACCKVAKLRLPTARHIVGLATEPGGTRGASEDLVMIDVSETTWTEENEKEAREIQAEAGILLDESIELYRVHSDEYPETPTNKAARMIGSPADRLRERARLRRQTEIRARSNKLKPKP